MSTAKSDYLPEQSYAELTQGAALRIARELQGLTQGALSKASGVSQPRISAIESGREPMGLQTAEALALALDVHPAVLAFPNWRPGGGSNAGARKRARPARTIVDTPGRAIRAPKKRSQKRPARSSAVIDARG